jgi:hypothetical protein
MTSIHRRAARFRRMRSPKVDWLDWPAMRRGCLATHQHASAPAYALLDGPSTSSALAPSMEGASGMAPFEGRIGAAASRAHSDWRMVRRRRVMRLSQIHRGDGDVRSRPRQQGP